METHGLWNDWRMAWLRLFMEIWANKDEAFPFGKVLGLWRGKMGSW